MLGMISKLQSACSTLTNRGALSALNLKLSIPLELKSLTTTVQFSGSCHVHELYMNNCVHPMYLSAEMKEELAIPNAIHKRLLKVDRSPKSETPIAMLSALLGTWDEPDGRSKVKGNASNGVRDESELWKCVCSLKAMTHHHWTQPKCSWLISFDSPPLCFLYHLFLEWLLFRHWPAWIVPWFWPLASVLYIFIFLLFILRDVLNLIFNVFIEFVISIVLLFRKDCFYSLNGLFLYI